MIHLGPKLTRLRLDAALDSIAATFRGMTAQPNEHNCECHWGSAEDLEQLKVPHAELDPDLLRRSWQAPDWNDHASMLRRILPQFAAALVNGSVSPFVGMEEVGCSFARGQWQHWPARQAAAVREFLDAWWTNTLTEPEPAVAAHEVLALCAEASATLSPWLKIWEALTEPMADLRLAEAVAHWQHDLLQDQLPWKTWQDEEAEEATRAELTAWLVRHAPARLRPNGVDRELLDRIRLLGLNGRARRGDPHWPDRIY